MALWQSDKQTATSVGATEPHAHPPYTLFGSSPDIRLSTCVMPCAPRKRPRPHTFAQVVASTVDPFTLFANGNFIEERLHTEARATKRARVAKTARRTLCRQLEDAFYHRSDSS